MFLLITLFELSKKYFCHFLYASDSFEVHTLIHDRIFIVTARYFLCKFLNKMLLKVN